ncbi:MAG: hydroxyacid dehydrogenase [Betaproteobacteria bacterium]|nr:hydroxyacid dehydrogenase [Betaproteobacteria bacterium]
MKTVLLMDPIAAEGVSILKEKFQVVESPDSSPATVRQLAREADGIIIRSKLPDDIFDAAPRVKAVAIHGTGTDLVPLEAASRRGVMVSNLPGVNAQSVAEYCVLALLMLARNIVSITSALRTQPWDEARKGGLIADELADMTVGIVGVGEIGRRVAKICRDGFGMAVLGHQRRMNSLPSFIRGTSLEELLRQSDFVILACPLTADTKHLINETTLALMKPSAFLVNVGRGAVIKEVDLVQALAARKIRGAMLDVYEHYRLEPGHPLLKLDNVILTPHVGGGTRAARGRASVAAAAEMLRMLSGERPLNLVNPEVLQREKTA